MKWIVIASLMVLAGQAGAAPPIDQSQLVKINDEALAVRSVASYFGASFNRFKERRYELVMDEATLPAMWEAEKKVFGEKQANEYFGKICVYSAPCLSQSSDLYAKIFMDMFSSMQDFVIRRAWNRDRWCEYWARFYHAGGIVKLEKKTIETKANFKKRIKLKQAEHNRSYAESTKKILRHELKKAKAGYWKDPIALNQDDQMVLYASLLYISDVAVIKTIRRKEGGRHGKEMGHESPNNYEVFGNSCVPERARQFGKGARSYNIALQNFVLKNAWWRKEFFRYYAKKRGMGDQAAKYVKIVLEERVKRMETLRTRTRLQGYNPAIFESAVQGN